MIKKIPIAVMISGRGTNMISLINACEEKDFPAKISVVISDKNAPGLEIAKNKGIPVEIVDQKLYKNNRKEHERDINKVLKKYNVKIVCLAGYMRVLTPYLVNEWAGKMLNIHPSLLPNFPGLHTHERALSSGASEHGCTIHLVTNGVDEGPLLGQKKVPILKDDTPSILAKRVLDEEHKLYPKILKKFILENYTL